MEALPVVGQPVTPTLLPATPRSSAAGEAAFFADAAIPLEVRERKLAELAREKTPSAVRTLLEVARSGCYLAAASTEQLGWVDDPGVKSFLREVLTDDSATNVRRLCAAVNALARLEGELAVPDLASLLAKNRERDDGLNALLEEACVKALGDIGSPTALPVLREELERFGKGSRQDLDYGLAVAQALWKSQPGGEEARRALREYAGAMEARLPTCIEQVRADMTAAGATEAQLARGESMVVASYRDNIRTVNDLLKGKGEDR
jgi:HEAT repeat protein